MQYTSLGYHTFSISERLTSNEARELYTQFENCSGIVPIPPDKHKSYKVTKDIESCAGDKFIKRLQRSPDKYYSFVYPRQEMGLRWTLRISKYTPGFIPKNAGEESKPCSIKATINPKIYAGIRDYVAAADVTHLGKTVERFNGEAARISPILGTFDDFSLNRIDYCVNFDMKELGIPATREQMMQLIGRGNIPAKYVEYTKYNEKSHREKPMKGSFYLMNDSVNINCYDKHYHLEQKFPNCPDIKTAEDVIRFEVQYKYHKVFNETRRCGNHYELFQNLGEMLSDDECEDVVGRYYKKVVMFGDYYTLDLARKKIEMRNFHINKEKRLIDCLELVNRCRGVARAKATLHDKALNDFNMSLRDLASEGVNPVTIPREWGIPYIRNLLSAYYDKISDVRFEQQQDETRNEMLSEALAKKSEKKKYKK